MKNHRGACLPPRHELRDTKSNMAAAIHYEQLICLLSKVSCKCDTSNLTDLGTLNSFLILF